MNLLTITEETKETAYVVGFIPRDADCSRCRHGILHGLLTDFPTVREDAAFAPEGCIGFGRPQGPGEDVPIYCSGQITTELADLMFQWVRGFCRGFLYHS